MSDPISIQAHRITSHEGRNVDNEVLIERIFQGLITGNRSLTRSIVEDVRATECTTEELVDGVYWPTLEMISTLFRADQLSVLAHHYATRLLRSLVDQAQASYTQKERNGRHILMFSGPGETDELCGQITADRLEAYGYTITYAGGGVACDEILAEVGSHRPDILLMFSSTASDAPMIRQIIDTVREIAACPELQIVVGGGVFTRAEGLAEEIGADAWANDPPSLIETLETQRHRRATPDQQTVGRSSQTVDQQVA